MLRFTVLHREGFPIRKSVGRSLFAAHHSLSQLVTSFIGSWCQGIHLTLLFAWTSCIMYLTILWFSLNCLSFFELYVQDYIDSLRMKRLLFAFCTCYLSCTLQSAVSTFRWNCIFPFRLERLIISLRLFVLFCSFSTQIFLLFDCQRSFEPFRTLVGLDGLEPSTSRLSGARSSHLSYKPEFNS